MKTIAIRFIESHIWLRDHIRTLCGIGIFGFAFLVTFAVYRVAWVSEDSFITLRYVNNTINGYGAVFNVGEYVQGYTHPLWYLMLLAGSYISRNEILTAIVLGLILTFFMLLLFGITLLKHTNSPIAALIIFGLACGVFISSDIWVSFQTGGLENALSHLLILLVVSESYFHKGERPGLLLLWLSSLCLSRPDYAIFAIPFGILVLPHLRSIRAIGLSFVAMFPPVIWLFFAWWYYGSALPNTGAAKLGVHSSLLRAIGQGISYIADWSTNDPIAAGITAAILIYCARVSRINKIIRVILFGIVMHISWVIFIGGDFMRGRFFMPVLTASIITGSFELLRKLKEGSYHVRYVHLLLSLLIFVSAVFISLLNALGGDSAYNGFFVNERQFYRGYSLSSYLREGHITSPYLDLTFANDLRAYADVCGPVTVHYRSPGTIGYLAGPEVTIIDTLGLTNQFIANLPRKYLIDPIPRPGHPDKYISVRYLALRGDIALLPNWETSVKQQDCSLLASVEKLAESTQYWSYPYGIVDVELPAE